MLAILRANLRGLISTAKARKPPAQEFAWPIFVDPGVLGSPKHNSTQGKHCTGGAANWVGSRRLPPLPNVDHFGRLRKCSFLRKWLHTRSRAQAPSSQAAQTLSAKPGRGSQAGSCPVRLDPTADRLLGGIVSPPLGGKKCSWLEFTIRRWTGIAAPRQHVRVSQLYRIQGMNNIRSRLHRVSPTIALAELESRHRPLNKLPSPRRAKINDLNN